MNDRPTTLMIMPTGRVYDAILKHRLLMISIDDNFYEIYGHIEGNDWSGYLLSNSPETQNFIAGHYITENQLTFIKRVKWGLENE